MPLRVLCCVLFLCCTAHAASVQLWDGTTHNGRIAFARNTWQVDDGQQRLTLSAHEVASIRFDTDHLMGGSDLARVTLTDGSLISGTVQPSSRLETVPLERSGTVVELPSDSVAAIELGALDPGASPGEAPAPPYIVMCNGKTVAAEVQWITYLEVGIGTEAGRIRLQRDQVHRCVLRPTSDSAPKAGSVRLSTAQGDAVTGVLLSLSGEVAELKVGSQTMRFPRNRLLRIDRHDERSRSLLSLEPVAVTTTPYLSLIRPPRFNKSLFDGSLRAHGIRYQTGIASHSKTTISYDLGGTAATLLVDVGIDTTISSQGDAVCVIRGDGKELATVQVSGDRHVQPLTCDLTGIKRLDFLVDYGAGGSTGDYVTWGDPLLLTR